MSTSDKKFIVSTDTNLHFNMLADNKKLKLDNISEDNIEDSKTSENSVFMNSDLYIGTSEKKKSEKSNNNSISSVINSDDLIKADNEEFVRKQELFNFKNRVERDSNIDIVNDVSNKNMSNNSNSKMKVNLNEINDINDIPYHLLDDKTKKFKRMEKYAQLITIKHTGIKLTKEYNIDSDYDEMCFEVDFWSNYRSKQDGVNLGKSFMLNAIQGIEFLNDRYDPFGFKLGGWHDQIQISSNSYDGVFGELYEKYKGKGGKMAPEIKIILMIAASAASFHASKKMTERIPALETVLKNNPELLSHIQNSVNNSIGGKSKNKNDEQQKNMYKQMQQLKEQQKKYKEIQEKQENITKKNVEIEKQINKINENKKEESGNIANILNRIKAENLVRKADNILSNSSSSNSSNNDSSENTLTINSSGNPIKRKRRKKSVISIKT